MISLRLMEDTLEDYTLMREWFLEPELQQWVWCNKKGEPPVSLERVIEKYSPRVKNPVNVFPYFILKNNQPIGYIQYYINDEKSIGIDMWLGVKKDRNKGIGTDALRQMVEILHKKYPNVTQISIDPDKDNIKAINCYKKVGFVYDRDIEEEHSVLMVINYKLQK